MMLREKTSNKSREKNPESRHAKGLGESGQQIRSVHNVPWKLT